MPSTSNAGSSNAITVSDSLLFQSNVCLEALSKKAVLNTILEYLKPEVSSIFRLARTCKHLWSLIALDENLWLGLYLENEPLMNAQLKKQLKSAAYSKNRLQDFALKPLQRFPHILQTPWLRCCCLLWKRPKLVLVLSGKDPILVRKLGEPDSATEKVVLGINYHLDDYLDDDEKRFTQDLPTIFQELDFGDLIITTDFKGAGCYTALPDPKDSSGLNLILNKNGQDTAGYGVLKCEVAPPTFPLSYYCDASMHSEPEIVQTAAKSVYWWSYTELKDGSVYSWEDAEIFDDFAFL